MAKRPHLSTEHFPKSDPMGQAGDYPRGGLGGSPRNKTPQQPAGEVSTQKRMAANRDRPDPYEAGMPAPSSRGFNKPGGRQRGMAMDDVYSAMPHAGHQSATAPGALARPGNERNSSTMDARSSVPTSIQQGPNCRDRFGSLDYGEKNVREDNAELDDGSGTGRRSRGSFRDGRRM